MLFDPSKQQLDLPAFAVERSDLGGRSPDVVTQDGEQTAVLAAQDDATQEDRQTGALLRVEIDNPVAFNPGLLAVMLADWAQGEPTQPDVALGTGDKAAAGVVQLAPPGVIDIGLVEDVSATRLDRLSAAGHHVVDGGRLGALTRLAAIPLIIVMVVAIVSTKLPIWAGQDVWIFHLPKLPRYGF